MGSSSSKVASEVTKKELLLALEDVVVTGGDPAVSLLSPNQGDYDAALDVWVDAFRKDPLMLYAMNLGSDADSFNDSQKQLQMDFLRNFLGWPNRLIAIRKKGFVIGIRNKDNVTTTDEPTFAGAVSLLPSSQRLYTFWDIVSNVIAIGPPTTVGGKTKNEYGPFAEKRFNAMDILEKKKHSIMNGPRKRYIYVQTVGVLSSYHGKGYGGKMLRMVFNVADSLDAYLYLETESAENESFYKHLGFETIETLDLSVEGDDETQTMYLMVRNPNNGKL